MKCTCPKCRQSIELVLPDVTEEGKTASCPACKAGFTVYKESFAGRALQRTGEISCSSCGNQLGPQMHCASCGAPYPDYLVAALGRRKKKSQKVELRSSPFRKQEKGATQLPSLDSAYQASPALKKQDAGARRFSKGALIATAVLVLVALGATGAGIYVKKKAEAKYLRNFALTAYGIQVGVDMSRSVCQRMAGDWKAGVEAGKVVTPRTTVQDEKELNGIKANLSSVKANLAVEPEKFKGCSAKMAKLENTFNKMHTLALTPGSSLPAFTNSIDKLDAEYKQAAREFKAGLPPKVLEELQDAAKRYRGLRPLLQ